MGAQGKSLAFRFGNYQTLVLHVSEGTGDCEVAFDPLLNYITTVVKDSHFLIWAQRGLLLVQLGPTAVSSDKCGDRVSQVCNGQLAVKNESEKAGGAVSKLILLCNLEEVVIELLKHYKVKRLPFYFSWDNFSSSGR